MFHENARVFDDDQPRRSRLLRRCGVLNPELHPNHFRTHANGAVHDGWDIFRPAENIYNLNLLRHIFKTPVAFLAEHFPLAGVHRNNPVTRLLHVFRHPIARPLRIRRQPYHRNRLVRFQNLRDGIAVRLRAVWQRHLHRVVSSLFPARFVHTRSIAARNSIFSSGVPTETRTASGNPIHASGLTITPAWSNSSLIALASGPISMKTKFVWLGTGRSPSALSSAHKRFLSARFVSTERRTCPSSSSAASAAACDSPVTLKGVRSLFIAATMTSGPIPYPRRKPASP